MMVDYSGLSLKTLKKELEIGGVPTKGFLEKSEFVKAYEDMKRHECTTGNEEAIAVFSNVGNQSKHAKNEMVLYRNSNGETESATILEVHLENGNATFYDIRLDSSGREKQTDESHIFSLHEEKALTSSKSADTPQQQSRTSGIPTIIEFSIPDDLSLSERSTESASNTGPHNPAPTKHASVIMSSLDAPHKPPVPSTKPGKTSKSRKTETSKSSKPAAPRLPPRRGSSYKVQTTDWSFNAPNNDDLCKSGRSTESASSMASSQNSGLRRQTSVRSSQPRNSGNSMPRRQVCRTKSAASASKSRPTARHVDPKNGSLPSRSKSFSLFRPSKSSQEDEETSDKLHSLRPQRRVPSQANIPGKSKSLRTKSTSSAQPLPANSANRKAASGNALPRSRNERKLSPPRSDMQRAFRAVIGVK